MAKKYDNDKDYMKEENDNNDYDSLPSAKRIKLGKWHRKWQS